MTDRDLTRWATAIGALFFMAIGLLTLVDAFDGHWSQRRQAESIVGGVIAGVGLLLWLVLFIITQRDPR